MDRTTNVGGLILQPCWQRALVEKWRGLLSTMRVNALLELEARVAL